MGRFFAVRFMEAMGFAMGMGVVYSLAMHLTEQHHTPGASIQQFTYCYCNIATGLC
jgi:hypothetical protein